MSCPTARVSARRVAGKGSPASCSRDRPHAIPTARVSQTDMAVEDLGDRGGVAVAALLGGSEATPSTNGWIASEAVAEAAQQAPFTRVRAQSSCHPIGRPGHPHRNGPSWGRRLLRPIVTHAA